MVRFVRLAAVFALGFGTSMLISQGAAKTERFPQFENDEVKVWKTVVQPHVPLPLHRHDHGRVIIALSGGTMNVVSSKGEVEPPPVGDRQGVLATEDGAGNDAHGRERWRQANRGDGGRA